MASRRRRPLRAVFFDAGNTLLSMNYPAVTAQLQALGVATTVEAVQRAEWRARVRLDAHLAASGAPIAAPARLLATPTEGGSTGAPNPAGSSRLSTPSSTESLSTAARYVRHLLEHLGVRDPAVVDAMVAWRHAFNRPFGLWTTALSGAGEALALVREAGLTAAVISNSNGQVQAIMESAGLAPGLDFVIDSGDVGVEKPDPGIFRLALARAGVAPEEAAYIGDLYSIDVLGARGAGLEAVLLDPAGHWGPRDCATAPDVTAAVRLLLAAAPDRP